MNNQHDSNSFPNLISSMELNHFKEKTDKLMEDLENNDIISAQQCIEEINEINGKSFYSVIGKLTRGLHDAISDLSISSSKHQSVNNKTRVDLNYVISLTDDAAKKTLDMTEQSAVNICNLSNSNVNQAKLIDDYLANNTPDEETSKLLEAIASLCPQNQANIDQINRNTTEIVMAQNFQDITSQTITKAMNIIKEVEDSLIALTQYANLLSKLSRFGDITGDEMILEESKELKSDIGQLNNISEAEHLDQGDVDDLLSSLGF